MQDWILKEDSASPTVCQKSIMIIAVINIKEGRDAMTVDILNAFIQMLLPDRYQRKSD